MAEASMERREIERRRSDEDIDNRLLWEELRYIRRKVDGLEQKILILFGMVGAIGTAAAIAEIVVNTNK